MGRCYQANPSPTHPAPLCKSPSRAPCSFWHPGGPKSPPPTLCPTLHCLAPALRPLRPQPPTPTPETPAACGPPTAPSSPTPNPLPHPKTLNPKTPILCPPPSPSRHPLPRPLPATDLRQRERGRHGGNVLNARAHVHPQLQHLQGVCMHAWVGGTRASDMHLQGMRMHVWGGANRVSDMHVWGGANRV